MRAMLLVLALSVPAAAPIPAPGDAASLAWLAGRWTGSRDGIENEEVWTAPRGGSLLGLHRDVSGGRTVSFEFFRIEAADGALVYWASPGGRPATPFRAIQSASNRIVFENREHDFPTRILYWLAADGALHARIEGTLQGKAAGEEWTWRRAD